MPKNFSAQKQNSSSFNQHSSKSSAQKRAESSKKSKFPSSHSIIVIIYYELDVKLWQRRAHARVCVSTERSISQQKRRRTKNNDDKYFKGFPFLCIVSLISSSHSLPLGACEQASARVCAGADSAKI